MFTPKTLGHGSLMTMIPQFLDETVDKSMNYRPKQIHVTNLIQSTIKSCHEKIPNNLNQLLPCELSCSLLSTKDFMDYGPRPRAT